MFKTCRIRPNNAYQYENYHEKLLFLAAQSLTTGALEDDQIAFEQIMNICRGAKQVSLRLNLIIL